MAAVKLVIFVLPLERCFGEKVQKITGVSYWRKRLNL
jgi:hypothetical protein